MNEQVYQLVQEGLYQENLSRLVRLCSTLFSENPSLYGTLIFIFNSLAEEYDNQGITQDRYQFIINSVQQPILTLLQAQEKPEIFLERLNQVFRGFHELRRTM